MFSAEFNGSCLHRLAILLSAVLLGPGCRTIYYNFWETFGVEKRDLLQDSLASAQESQEELRKQFKDTLERIRHEYKFEGGELESTYDKISSDYERAESKAKQLKGDIDKVDKVAHDLFAEWKDEAQSINNAAFRRDSLTKLAKSKDRFAVMLMTMRQLEKNLDQVLVRLRDHKLYLKHNLNAKALAALKFEFKTIEGEIKKLIEDINKSILEAATFSRTIST